MSTPFGSGDLAQAFPAVKDSGFDPAVQLKTWLSMHEKYFSHQVVRNTRIHWLMLRDIYLLALAFLLAFCIAWAINHDLPFQIVNVYLFLFGAQYLFLLMMARKLGYRLVDNVLGVALGLDEVQTGG